MRTIKAIHTASYHPIADLITYSPMPSHTVDMIDPFLFLNHHGYQQYPKNNRGLPFGPHPHRGMETVTFIIEGELSHKDNTGHESTIRAGGIQWMTAGSGIIHAEVSSDEFKRDGGPIEILQLWINLPARLKMTTPAYKGLQENEIPVIGLGGEEGQNYMQLISGELQGVKGPFESLTGVFMSTLYLSQGTEFTKQLNEDENVFFYIVKGKVKAGQKEIPFRNLVEWNNDGESIAFTAEEETIVLLGHAAPYNEPVVARGPFVMNTEEEIMQAYDDYSKGRFGGMF